MELFLLNCVSLPGYTLQCGMNYTDIKLQTLLDKDLILLIENIIRGRISSPMGYRYVETDENKTILYIDANSLCGWALSEYLPCDEIKFVRKVKLEEFLNTSDDSDIGYFNEVDLKNPNDTKNKTENYPFAPEKNYSDVFSGYMKKTKPDTCTQTKKLICDWSDNENYLIHYRMLNFYVRHGM